jgi:hypothetical protein
MFKFDFENTRVLKSGLSAEKWGKKIVIKTWQFVLECWFTRNEIEHDNGNNPILRAKEKLVEHIIWVIAKITDDIEHPYKGI